MSTQPNPLFVGLPPNSSGQLIDGIQITVASQAKFRENVEVACPVAPQSQSFTEVVGANSVGTTISCAAVPTGFTGYLSKIELSSSGYTTVGNTGGGYTLCASGCSQTIPASPFTISAGTHGQGVNAFAYAVDSSGNQIFPPSFNVSRDASGDLTITYSVAPSRIVIMGPSSVSGLVTCQWAIMSGAAVIGYLVTGQGSADFTPPHRFFAQCAAGSAFSVVPTNPTGGQITVFATFWWDYFN